MLDDLYPVRWIGRHAIVTLPEHIDVTNAGQIREELLSVINRGPAALIADMTATISCDQAGAEAVVRAYQRAITSGTELRLAVPAGIVSRMLSLSGLDRLVSIYPSLEAATVARAPAAILALVPRPAGPHGARDRPSRRDGRPGGRLRAAGRPPDPPDGNALARTLAQAWKLLDALHDGVALTDADGKFALANTRLAEMFGYEHAELIGRPVDAIIPAGLQEACQSYRSGGAPPGARLIGLRRDGTTFPVEVSFGPVLTDGGQFALTVIRDLTEVECARMQLLDTIGARLCRAGLSLQASIGLPAEPARQCVSEALELIEGTIRDVRAAALTTQDSRPS